MKKISICTVCMNRLSFLRETLPENILENKSYPFLEFVLLDYNSGDGMEQWARKNLMPYIDSGILKYYKTTQPAYFDLSHSKNMCLKLATGDILCMIDADNYAGSGYAAWVNSIFGDSDTQTIITTLRKHNIPYRDQGGKLCFHRSLFATVSGFDEALVGYGVEDVDLAKRMDKAGGRRVYIDNPEFLRCISHSTFERIRNFHLINNLDAIYIQVTGTNSKQRVLYLLTNREFVDLTYDYDKNMISNNVQAYSGWTIGREGKREGYFNRRTGYLDINYSDGASISLRENGNGRLSNPDGTTNEIWEIVPSSNGELFHGLIMSYGECLNRLKSRENDRDAATINPGGWGNGTVYLNFDRNHPIDTATLQTSLPTI